MVGCSCGSQRFFFFVLFACFFPLYSFRDVSLGGNLVCKNALITFTQLHTFTGPDITDGLMAQGPVKVYAGQIDQQIEVSGQAADK